jgi:hypothetical protein
MFRKSLLLACMTVLALGVHARADLFSSTTTLNPVTFSGGTPGIPQNGIDVTQVTSASQPVQVDVSYTVNTNKANPGAGTIYATGVLQLTNYSANPPGTGGSFNTFGSNIIANSNYNFVFALQGHAIPPPVGSPPGTLSAQFDKGAFNIYAVGLTTPAANNPATWVPAGSVSVYSATLGPQVAVGVGPGGSGLAGVQPASSQNTASFVPGGNQTPGQVLLQTFASTFFMPPQSLFGFQAKIQETDNAQIGPVTGGNAALNAAFQAALAGLPNQGFGSTTPFTTFAFNPDGTGANGDTVQTIGFQLFPVTSSTVTVVPEPASMLVWAGIAAGLGIYRGVRRSRLKKAA